MSDTNQYSVRSGEISPEVIYRGFCDMKKWPLLLYVGFAVITGGFLFVQQERQYEASSQLWVAPPVSGLTRVITERPLTTLVEPLTTYDREAFIALLQSKEFRQWILDPNQLEKRQQADSQGAIDEACFAKIFRVDNLGIGVSSGSSANIIVLTCVSDDAGCSEMAVDLAASLFVEWLDHKRLIILNELELAKGQEIGIFKEQIAPDSPEFKPGLGFLEGELVKIKSLKLIPQSKVSILSRSDQVRLIVSPSRTALLVIPVLVFLFFAGMHLFIAICRNLFSQRWQST